MTRARLGVTLLGALLLITLSATPPAVATAPVSPQLTASGAGWLDRLNQWRTSTGVTPLSENTTWSAGDYDHAVYMVKNDLVTHYETTGTPYYTTAGDQAAQNGNIQVSSTTATTDPQAIDWWMAAPFHSMGMMDPRLSTTGFGSYREVKSGWQEGATLDTIRGNSFTGGRYPVYFPGNGTTEPLTSYGGGEFPDPLQACSGYAAPTGLPVYIEVGGNVNTTVGAHSFTGNGTSLAHCVIDSSNSALHNYLYTRGAVVLVPQKPLQNGVTYTVSLTVNGTARTWSFTVGAFVACRSVTESASPASPALPGTTVAFAASASGCPSPVYQFWILAPGSSTWQIVQPWSASATFNWNTTGLPRGNYLYTVWAKQANSPGAVCSSLGCTDTYFPAPTYVLGTPCTSVTDTASPPPPQLAGTIVTFTATSTGCPSPLYQFWVLAPGSTTWKVLQAYSTASTYSWNTGGLAAGTYLYTAWARDATSTGAQCGSLGCDDAFMAAAQYAVTSHACTSVTETASPGPPQVVGASVTFTATSTGCANPLYQFWVLPPGTTTWKILRPYSTSSTYTWSTTGLATGSYLYTAWVRDASSGGTQCSSLGCDDAYMVAATYALDSPCTAVSETAAPASPQLSSTTVTFTASAATCPHPQYQFWVLPPGSRTWQIMQPYSTANTFAWNTAGLAPGNYLYTVWARDASSPGTNCSLLGCDDAFMVAATYTLTRQPCTSVAETVSPNGGAARGNTVTFTATATGCSHPLFQFWILKPGTTTWQILQPYSTASTFAWNTTGIAAGGYMYTVWVRDASSTGVQCSSLGCDDAFFPGTTYALT